MNNKMEENAREGGRRGYGWDEEKRGMIFARVVAEHDVNERRV